MKPNRQKNAIVTEPLAAVKRGLRKRPTSSIGAEVRRSHITKAARRTVAIAKPPSVRALPQPWLGASMIVKISSPIAAVENTSPPRSIRGACGSRDVGTHRGDEDGRGGRDRRHREEDAGPGKMLEQPAADNRPEG